jgi:hypothetical protein
MKRKHQMTHTGALAFVEISQNVCGVYFDMNVIAIDSTI